MLFLHLFDLVEDLVYTILFRSAFDVGTRTFSVSPKVQNDLIIQEGNKKSVGKLSVAKNLFSRYKSFIPIFSCLIVYSLQLMFINTALKFG